MLFDALIVDPNPFSRGNLWQATLYEPNFRSVKAVSGLSEALAQLQNGNRFHVLLITSEFPSSDIKTFIPDAKRTDSGKEAAYVLVLKKKDQDAENVATSIVDGTDGLLLEPYSVHSLKQVAAIAARVKGEHERERARAAISLMLHDIIPKLDAYAEAKRKQQEPGSSYKDLKRLGAGLKKIVKEHQSAYAEVAHDVFQTASPRQTKSKYKGASKRVKQLVEKD